MGMNHVPELVTTNLLKKPLYQMIDPKCQPWSTLYSFSIINVSVAFFSSFKGIRIVHISLTKKYFHLVQNHKEDATAAFWRAEVIIELEKMNQGRFRSMDGKNNMFIQTMSY